MNEFIMNELSGIYVKILKAGRDKYDQSHQEVSISTAQDLESYSAYLGEMTERIESLLELTHKYARECLDRATEIRKEVNLSISHDGDPSKMFLVHRDMFKGMSWADINDREENKSRVLSDVDNVVDTSIIRRDFMHTPILYKSLVKINNVDIGFKFKVPIITKLSEMPSAFYWYGGDNTNPSGIYTCITRGFYVRVPFPNVVDSTKNFNKMGSIKCKNATFEECYAIRKELAMRHKSDIRNCTFAHKGDKYVKIGSAFRCPNMPRFGCHNYLSSDLKSVPDSDIKTILMYSLSDILLTSLWFQKQKSLDPHEPVNTTFNDIEIG